MIQKVLKINPSDNVIVALVDLKKDEAVIFNNTTFHLKDDVSAKHKFFESDMPAGTQIYMYGVVVGTTQQQLALPAPPRPPAPPQPSPSTRPTPLQQLAPHHRSHQHHNQCRNN